MVTLQNHVLSILAKSAKNASDDIIKLFDSSFEAFSEELRKRQDEINTLRSKLEESELKSMGPNSCGPAFLCVQCGVSLNCVIPIAENPKDHNTGNQSPQIIETDISDHQPLGHVPIIESETEEDFEFEVATEEDTCYSGLMQGDKNTDCIQTVQQEEPTMHKDEINLLIFPQKRGRGRPKKQDVARLPAPKPKPKPVPKPVPLPAPVVSTPVYMPPKRGRGRPRKTEVLVTLKSQPNMFSAPEQPKKAQIQEETVSMPQPVQPSPPQTSMNHSVSKDKPQTEIKVLSKSTRSGRRGRPPRRLLDPLLIPFAGNKSFLSGPKNHECEPVALTNKFKDKFVSKTVDPVPMPGKPVPMPEERIPMKEEPLPMPEEPVSMPEEPVSMPEEPVPMTEEPVSMPEEPVPMTEKPVPMPEEPVPKTEEPVPKTEEPVPMPEEPVSMPEEPVPMTEEPVPMTEEPVPLDDTRTKDQPYKTQPKKEKVWVKCPNCPRQYTSKVKMQAHKKIHHRKGEIACHICGLTFIGQSQMTNHLRVHTGEKPFSCSFCSRCFPNQSQYNKHLLSHTAPDYTCEVCGLKSSQVRKSMLKAHLRCKQPCSNCASIYT